MHRSSSYYRDGRESAAKEGKENQRSSPCMLTAVPKELMALVKQAVSFVHFWLFLFLFFEWGFYKQTYGLYSYHNMAILLQRFVYLELTNVRKEL